MFNDRLKVQAVKTAMRNPQISRMLLEAANAPIGSTARAHAKNVIRSLQAATVNRNPALAQQPMVQSFGGQGGPSTFSQPVQSYPISLQPATIKPYAFVAPPTPPPIVPNLNPPAQDGQGGGLTENTTYGGYGSSLLGSLGKMATGVKNAVTDTIFNTVPNAFSNYILKPISYATSSLTQTVNKNPAEATYRSNLYPNINSAISQNNPASTAAPSTSPFVGPEMPADYKSPVTSYPNLASTVSAGDSGFVGPTMPTTGGSSIGSTASALDGYFTEKFGAGWTGNQVALGILADANLLHEIFPDVPVDKLPVGASLSGQLQNLQENLKKEYNLDSLQSRVMQSLNDGMTITDDVTSYIRGKDEFLNSVDKMLDKAKTQFLNSSMRSDPFYKQSMQQYTGYLTTLKGRQTQRYVDFLNSSINYHNAQATQLQNAYNSAAQQVNEAFKWQSAITTEQYNSIKEMIATMYDTSLKKQGLVNSVNKDSIDLLKAQWGLAADVAKVLGPEAAAGYISQNIPGVGPITANDLNASDGKLLTDAQQKVVLDAVKDSNTIGSALSNPSVSGKVSSDVIAQNYAQSKAEKISAALTADASDIDTIIANAHNDQAEIQSLIQQGKLSQSALEAYGEKINNSISNGIKGYVQAHLDVIREALNRMKGASSATQFKNRWYWFDSDPENYFNTNGSDPNKLPVSWQDILFNLSNANPTVDWKSKTAQEIADLIYPS